MKSLPVFITAVLTLGAASLLDLSVRPAYAGLGATTASIEADRMSMKGQLRARSGAGYSVQEITAGSGTVVREYVSPSGVVFAVSWQGASMPNLQQTFGSYFTQFQAAVRARRTQQPHLRGHNHLEIHTPSLVVHAFGHMRQYFGVAYAPALMPANLSISDLH
ncbi:MAG TPA: DUF2844 domain-containing protein [Steroidobacteraceae bacterium]|jgi:hypothetical protein|nr:DUF2844 domain-containing protein [Steroidobacteraceae bacterium]